MDADRALFKEAKVTSATIRFVVLLGGKAEEQRSLVLRPGDTANSSKVTLYYDRDAPVAYEVTWFDSTGMGKRGGMQVLTGDYLPLIPPSN